MDFVKLILCVVALFCPPLAVLFGGGSVADFVINLLLTIVFWIPGVIHAWFIVLQGPMYKFQKIKGD